MSHPLDEGRDRFRRFVQATAGVNPRLPLVHSTDVFAIGNIVDDGGKLTPQPCPNFKPERLTYLFYGRPAYRPNIDEQPTGLEHYFPVCLIFKIGINISVKRVFPFDSGAFCANFYESFLHKNMRLGDFQLEADLETPGRVVKRFFSDNTNYVIGRESPSDAIDPSELEAHSYLAIASAKGANAVDSRGGGVELQTDQPIDLAESVEAVIMPSSQARSRVGQSLMAIGIEVIPYKTISRMRPNEYTGAIYELCVNYLCRKNLVDEARL